MGTFDLINRVHEIDKSLLENQYLSFRTLMFDIVVFLLELTRQSRPFNFRMVRVVLSWIFRAESDMVLQCFLWVLRLVGELARSLHF